MAPACVPRVSRKGEWATVSSLATALNAGVSSRRQRRYKPTMPSGAATRNGTRQPQLPMASADNEVSRA
ncbi:hypothetical protein D3C85_877030 [compost metagenome]